MAVRPLHREYLASCDEPVRACHLRSRCLPPSTPFFWSDSISANFPYLTPLIEHSIQQFWGHLDKTMNLNATHDEPKSERITLLSLQTTPSTMRSLLAATLAFTSFLSSTHALYFYLDGTTPKCFYEDLPKDTLVVGKYTLHTQAQRTQSRTRSTIFTLRYNEHVLRRPNQLY